MPQGPRDHESAFTALALGLVSIAAGPFTGIPAILIGRKALREIAAAPQQLTGAGAAWTGIISGWLGSFLLTSLALFGITASSQLAGIVVMLVGLVVGGLAVSRGFGRLPTALVALARHPITWAFAGAAALGGFGGAAVNISKAHRRAQSCVDGRSRINEALGRNDIDAARHALSDVAWDCVQSGQDLTTTRADIESKEAAIKKAQAEAEAAAKAKEAAERDKAAVEGFPAMQKQASELLRIGSTKAALGQWEDADDYRQRAASALASVRGTSVEQTKEFADLDAKLDALGKKLQPWVDRMAKQRAAAAALEGRKQAEQDRKNAEQASKDALKEAQLGKKPGQRGFDGCNYVCREAVKQQMNDPDSFECQSSTEPQVEGDYWTVRISYRGKNGFGAKVLDSSKCFIQSGEVVRITQ
jgi:hypothetical protein